jgi:hypothetical protein
MVSPSFARWRATVLVLMAILAVLGMTIYTVVSPFMRSSSGAMPYSTEAQLAAQELQAWQEMEAQQLAALPGPVFALLAQPGRGTQMTKTKSKAEKMVISFGLHGAHNKFLQGALKNVELARLYYPGWICRFYLGSGEQAVPAHVIQELLRRGAEVVYDDSSTTSSSATNGNAAMFARFRVATDPSVNRFLIRDVDSRLNDRESAAVAAWITSKRPLHIMRDHPTHCKYNILGGMWGATNGSLSLPTLGLALAAWRETHVWGDDMAFLTNHVWPQVQSSRFALAHDSHCCEMFANVQPFPTPRKRALFVGQAFNDKHRTRFDSYVLQPTPMQCRRRQEDTYG